ncbi:hypothetical protein TREMEDRAFT_66459 [Tremella mesenterica DSM 1558]|uniref:uncharacterized protein n=1 Tax=Tremella mesenterica (strain ATCC 24925 / CBS 8224 / DSM 1558 / NBRC 9311 / NRRL Y-6157 / RJB 2259-6 / UBC 559-6) TaxID=578456 RepID=UPI00032BEBE3|nr:uncharacterized protein TREMEDRAFT_66459 [Tremella mesenterica DSM 1558]EIW65546.1 hypothetical protein TREMEDRAFT_66459 [Tremella mesenterica DSM 1558]
MRGIYARHTLLQEYSNASHAGLPPIDRGVTRNETTGLPTHYTTKGGRLGSQTSSSTPTRASKMAQDTAVADKGPKVTPGYVGGTSGELLYNFCEDEGYIAFPSFKKNMTGDDVSCKVEAAFSGVHVFPTNGFMWVLHGKLNDTLRPRSLGNSMTAGHLLEFFKKPKSSHCHDDWEDLAKANGVDVPKSNDPPRPVIQAKN